VYVWIKYFFLIIAHMGMGGNYLLFLTNDRHLDRTRAAFYVSLNAMLSFCGKGFFGIISDKVYKPFLVFITAILQVIGFIFLFSIQNGSLTLAYNEWQFIMFPVIFGFGTGGCMSLHQIMHVWCFGLRELGMIMGSFGFVTTLLGMAASLLFAGLHDATGTYFYSFLLGAICSFFSGVFGLFLRSWETEKQQKHKIEVEEIKNLIQDDLQSPSPSSSTTTRKHVTDSKSFLS